MNKKRESKLNLGAYWERITEWFRGLFATKPCANKTGRVGAKSAKGQNKNVTNNPEKKERKWWVTLLLNGVIAVCALIVVVVIVNAILGAVTRHGKNKDVPDMVGVTLEEARGMAAKNELQIVVNDSLYVPFYEGGVILEQRPVAGKAKVKSGRKIYVIINSQQRRMIDMPHVAGYSLRQAIGNLQSVGLEIEELEYRPDLANNYVLEQMYEGVVIPADSAMSVPAGAAIKLVVGSNQTSAEPVPNLIGKTLREANNILWSAGFNVGRTEFDGELNLLEQTRATIYEQSPVEGMNGYQGDRISLKLHYTKEQQ
jgi:beta-lactam-binding protein with PASTA domain